MAISRQERAERKRLAVGSIETVICVMIYVRGALDFNKKLHGEALDIAMRLHSLREKLLEVKK